MAPAVPTKNTAGLARARIPEQPQSTASSGSYHDMFPSSSSAKNQGIHNTGGGRVGTSTSSVINSSNNNNHNSSSSSSSSSSSNSGNTNSSSSSSSIPSSDRRRLVEELIRDGPSGPNRDKVLRSVQELQASSSSSEPRMSQRGKHARGTGPSGGTALPPDESAQSDGVNGGGVNEMHGPTIGMGGMGSSGYGSGMMGGGGYGGYGGMGGGMYGMHGMGMNPMMMGGMGMGGGPMTWVYSLNAIVHSIGYAINVVGMNSHMLYQLFNQIWAVLQRTVEIVKRSAFRRWLQQKSRRSRALRAVFVIVAMGVAHQAMKLAKAIIAHQRRQLAAGSGSGMVGSAL